MLKRNNNYIHCSLYKHSSQGCEGGLGWGWSSKKTLLILTKINVQDSRLRPLYQYHLLPRPDHVMQVADSLAHHGSHPLSQLLQQTNRDEKPDNAKGGLPSGFRLTHTNCTQDTGTDTLHTQWNSLKTNKVCVLKHSGILLKQTLAKQKNVIDVFMLYSFLVLLLFRDQLLSGLGQSEFDNHCCIVF